MGTFNLLQVALSLAAALILVRSVRQTLWLAPLEVGPYDELLRRCLSAGGVERAQVLARAASPSWIGEFTEASLAEDEPWEPVPEFAYRGLAGVGPLRTLGRMASPLALMGAILELGRGFRGGAGLAALQKGLAEQLALEAAITTLLIGACTSLVCFSGARLLLQRGKELERDLNRVGRTLTAWAESQG